MEARVSSTYETNGRVLATAVGVARRTDGGWVALAHTLGAVSAAAVGIARAESTIGRFAGFQSRGRSHGDQSADESDGEAHFS
jgi:hypothetical protein